MNNNAEMREKNETQNKVGMYKRSGLCLWLHVVTLKHVKRDS